MNYIENTDAAGQHQWNLQCTCGFHPLNRQQYEMTASSVQLAHGQILRRHKDMMNIGTAWSGAAMLLITEAICVASSQK